MISARGLKKSYGQVEAVRGVDFDVQPGRITGFLGPNGSGKTTTLRMLLGLVRPSSGQATFDGVPYSSLRTPLQQVGAALDGQAFARRRTGLGHMMCWAGLAGADQKRAKHLLDVVDLSGAANRPVAGYSLGMKQRLALATALLGDPHTLILDEPANGLDPDGILWLRKMLVSLAAEGRTVFVASHLLAEAQRMVDDVLLIRDGEVLYSGPCDNLLQTAPTAPDAAPADLERAYLHLTRKEG